METIVRKLTKSRQRKTSDAARQIENVDWFQDCSRVRHVISPIDSKPKVSRGYHECVGVAAVGTDKKTKKPISFLTHQSVDVVRNTTRQVDFERDLKDSLKELKSKSVPGSVEVSVFGGHATRFYPPKGVQEPPSTTYAYGTMVKQVEKITSAVLHKGAKVVAGPSNDFENPVNVALNTKRRKLHVFVPQGHGNSHTSFKAARIDRQRFN